MKFLLMTAAVALSAGGALAQDVADQVVAGLQAQGFTRIEVDTGPTQVKVEGVRGTTKVEYVYDRATGALIRQETGRVDAGDDTRAGIEYDSRDDDFVRTGGDGSYDDDPQGDDLYDDNGGDRDRGHGNDDDGYDDDNPGRGHGDRADDDDDDDGEGRGRGRGRGGDDD